MNLDRRDANMISFIIPAYNEERLLGASLDALRAAAQVVGEAFEIIVVDDASTDATMHIAAAHNARVVRVAHRQISATRNSGARTAIGDKLIFVDADTVVGEAVLRAAIVAMRDGAIGGGCALEFDGHVPAVARLLLPVVMCIFRVARIATGCFLFCTRNAFDAVGGFDESYFGAEEVVLSAALKRHGKFVIVREAVVTSGRKLRTHSTMEMLTVLASVIWNGPKAVQKRQGMDFWYAERREDPRNKA